MSVACFSATDVDSIVYRIYDAAFRNISSKFKIDGEQWRQCSVSRCGFKLLSGWRKKGLQLTRSNTFIALKVKDATFRNISSKFKIDGEQWRQ
ncbi:hypothetical protein C0J52_27939 [Blattella germanica]|nr:hypothetical protein C0J52_27939 [Blattella germanica]